MTPRRYLSTVGTGGLTFDNRDAGHCENLQDEIAALRNGRRELLAENAALKLQVEELAETVRQRDEQIAAWNDARKGEVLAVMRVELTFSNGMKQVIQAEAVAFVKECKGCGAEFRTDDPRREYHAPDCKDEAKYHRRIRNGWG